MTLFPHTAAADPFEKIHRPRGKLRAAWVQPLGLLGAALMLTCVVLAALAPWLVPFEPNAQAFPRFSPPTAQNWFGTDQLGRDIFARVVYGGRISLPYAALLVILSAALGIIAGAVAGYFGGWIDGAIMRAADLVMAFPDIILAMAVIAALGPSLFNAVLAIVIVSWPIYARLVRALVLTLRDEPYVQSARLLGRSAFGALWRDIRPNIAGPVLVLAALEFGHAVLILSGLSFLGLGAQPPAAEWGSMVSEGAKYFDKWWMSLFPGLAILTVVLAANFIGDTLRDAFDPKSARSFR